MDGEPSVDDVRNATAVDLIVVAASPSVPLHVTFDEPLATVFQELEEGEVTSEPELREQPEPAAAVVASVQPSPAPADKSSTEDCVRCRSRSARRRRHIRKSHERRTRSRSLRCRNYYCDHPFVVQIAEEELASDYRHGGYRKSKEYLPPRTGHSRPRDTERHGDWHCSQFENK